MALIFRTDLDDKSLTSKLNALPAKAQATGEQMGKAMQNGVTRTGSMAGMAYAQQMKASAARAMSQPSSGETTAAKTNAKKLAEFAAKEDAKARADWDRQDRKADKDKARVRALEKAKVEQEEQERVESRRRMSYVARGVGAVIGYRAVAEAKAYGEILTDLNARAGGLTSQLAKQAASWREMAVAANTTSSRVALQSQMMDDMQTSADEFRGESVIQGTREDFFDMMSRMTGGKTIQEQKTDSFAARQGAMENFARSNAIIAQRRQAFLSSTHGMGNAEKDSVIGGKIDKLSAEQEGLGDPMNMNPAQLRRYQRLAAEIKSLEPFLFRARGAWQAQADAARGMMTPVSKIRDMQKERSELSNRLSKGVTAEERAQLEARINGLDIGMEQEKIGLFNRTLDTGLMGAGGRRDTMRQMRREQREIGRIGRMANGKAQEGRAFQNDIVKPEIGRDAANNALAGKVQDVKDVLDKILTKIDPPARLN
jgi:hypothetical protein